MSMESSRHWLEASCCLVQQKSYLVRQKTLVERGEVLRGRIFQPTVLTAKEEPATRRIETYGSHIRECTFRPESR